MITGSPIGDSAASVIAAGCRPSRIASTMSGESNVSRRIRLT
jgi:hypothetical protein